jgi:hypothetical protein
MDMATQHRKKRKNVKKHGVVHKKSKRKHPLTYDKHHMTINDKKLVKTKQLKQKQKQKQKNKVSKKTLEKRGNESFCCDCNKTLIKKHFSVNQWSSKQPMCRECVSTMVVEEKRLAKEKRLLGKNLPK